MKIETKFYYLMYLNQLKNNIFVLSNKNPPNQIGGFYTLVNIFDL